MKAEPVYAVCKVRSGPQKGQWRWVVWPHDQRDRKLSDPDALAMGYAPTENEALTQALAGAPEAYREHNHQAERYPDTLARRIELRAFAAKVGYRGDDEIVIDRAERLYQRLDCALHGHGFHDAVRMAAEAIVADGHGRQLTAFANILVTVAASAARAERVVSMLN